MASVQPITTKIASFIPGPIISVPPLLTGVPVLENMPPYLNGLFSQQSPTLGTNGERQSLRCVRPFKAFSDEILLGNYPAPSSSNSFSSTLSPPNYYNHSKNRSASVSSNTDIKNGSPETENCGNTMSARSTNMNTDLDMKSDAHGSGDSNSSFSNSYSNCQQPDTSSGCQNRRKSRTMPEELKDAAYWERRRKNNEAAKRSRDARRQKEDAITLRAKQLHEENNQLRFYLTTMQKHIAFQE
ncbi:Cell death specification protein 2, partial [Stegodyphus mimosarum]